MFKIIKYLPLAIILTVFSACARTVNTVDVTWLKIYSDTFADALSRGEKKFSFISQDQSIIFHVDSLEVLFDYVHILIGVGPLSLEEKNNLGMILTPKQAAYLIEIINVQFGSGHEAQMNVWQEKEFGQGAENLLRFRVSAEVLSLLDDDPSSEEENSDVSMSMGMNMSMIIYESSKSGVRRILHSLVRFGENYLKNKSIILTYTHRQ